MLKRKCQDFEISGNESALVSKQNINQQKVMLGVKGRFIIFVFALNWTGCVDISIQMILSEAASTPDEPVSKSTRVFVQPKSNCTKCKRSLEVSCVVDLLEKYPIN